MNLQDALSKITELQHLTGVYEELIDHLAQFLPTDLGEADAELILEDCFQSTVTPDVIDCVQQELQTKRAEVEKQLIELNKMRVTNGQAKKKPATPKKSAATKPKKK